MVIGGIFKEKAVFVIVSQAKICVRLGECHVCVRPAVNRSKEGTGYRWNRGWGKTGTYPIITR